MSPVGHHSKTTSSVQFMNDVHVHIELLCVSSNFFSFVSVRKWKSKSGLGKEGKWEFEIGEDMRPVNLDLENITESRGNVSGSLT